MRLPWMTLGFVLLPALGLRPGDALAARGANPIRLHITFVEMAPVATISIGGRAVQAIVDTSAGDADGALTLGHDLIEAAGGVHLGDAVMNDERGRRLIRPRFRIPVVSLGGHTFHDVNAVEALSSADEKSPIPNVIGKYFLGEYFVVIDFAAATVSLWPSDTRNPSGVRCGRARIPMEPTREERLAVSVFDTPAGRVRLAWSTSSGYSVLAQTTANRLSLATITHGPNSPSFYRSDTLSVAGREMGPLEFVVLPVQLPEDFDGMLGHDFFVRHIVCLDYQRREIRVR